MCGMLLIVVMEQSSYLMDAMSRLCMNSGMINCCCSNNHEFGRLLRSILENVLVFFVVALIFQLIAHGYGGFWRGRMWQECAPSLTHIP